MKNIHQHSSLQLLRLSTQPETMRKRRKSGKSFPSNSLEAKDKYDNKCDVHVKALPQSKKRLQCLL